MISLLGGVALFLFGMTLMGDGLKKVAGNKLEIILYKLTSTPLKGVLLGTGVTAVIQSSSATSVMVVGFVNSGMMQVRQAIGIVLGSILGTSITGWILCLSDISGSGWVSLLSTATLTGIVAVAGIVLRMFCKDLTKHHIGDILLGFAVLMYGMSSMSGAVAPLKDSAAFIELLTRFSNPLLGVLVGTVFTCILQSASAAVGILQALAITGTITFSVAFPITLGIAIGAAVPVLLSSLGASVKGKRTAYVYLLIDVIGALVWGVVFYAVNAAVRFPFLDMTMTTVSIALLNTIFRFATVLLLTPMIPLLEKLVTILFPDKASTGALADIDRLEDLSAKIFAQVKADPKKLPQIRKFMDYYLPTTLKLLNAYDRMGAQGVNGENIDNTMQRVESMMSTIVAAFEKQLDMLFGSEAMDISTDITVLENMMKREGLSESDGVQASGGTATASQGDIKLEL